MIQNVFWKQTGTIRFHRWSRKKYAMFGSIGKCVTIGCVCKSIADASLGKGRQLIAPRREGSCAKGAVKEEDALFADGVPDNASGFLREGELCLTVSCLQKIDIVGKYCRNAYGNVSNIIDKQCGKVRHAYPLYAWRTFVFLIKAGNKQ